MRRPESPPPDGGIFRQARFQTGHSRRGGDHRVPVSGIPVSRYRWFILAVFVLSTTISYLDRQMLAALAPTVQGEFSLSDAQYGLLLTAFSIPYAVMAPFAGLL